MLKTASQTLVGVLEKRASSQEDRLLYNFIKAGKEHKLTYLQLDRKARAIASYLTKLNLKSHRALLLYPQGLDFIEAFMGCLYAGVIAVPLHPPANEAMAEKISHVASDCAPKIILSSSEIIKKMKMLNIANKVKQVPIFGKLLKLPTSNISDINKLPWAASDKISLILADKFSGALIKPDDIAFLQYTSGSTSMPKGVMVTHENIMHNEKMASMAFGTNKDDIGVSWLPLSHDMGLIGNALQPLYKGFPVIFSDPIDFIKDPFLWLNMISKYKASCTGAPNFGYDHCVNRISDHQKELLDLSSWRLAFNGAEPVKLKTLDRFYEAFKDCGFKKSAFDPVYGLAESTLFVTGSDLRRVCKTKEVDKKQLTNNIIKKPSSRKNKVVLVSSGHGYLDNELAIVDVKTMQKCSKNIVGEIWVKSRSNAKGYWNNKEATKETFQAKLKNGEGPYLRTGDLGFLDENGDLFVTGRLKDLIIIRGENHYPQDIEYSVEFAHDAIRKGCTATFSAEDKLVVVAEVKPAILKRSSPGDVILEISKAISSEHQIHLDDVVLIEPRSINKTTSGKIQRHKVKQLYLAGKLKEVYHGDVMKVHSSHVKKHFVVAHDEIEQKLSSIWCQVLSLESISIDEDFTELGGDSLAFMQAAMLIEQEFAVPIEIEQIYKNKNIIKLAKYIKKNSKKKNLFSKEVHSISAPLAPMQEWFFEQDFEIPNHWNTSFKFAVFSDTEHHYLEKSLNILVQHHDVLRARFRKTDGGIIQQIEAKETHKIFEKYDLHKGSKKHKQKLMDEIELEAQKSLDYENGPIVKMVYFDLGEEPGMVIFIIHHLVSDLMSMTILLNQLEYVYKNILAGKNFYLQPVKSNFLDYCKQLQKLSKNRKIIKQIGYWKKIINTKTPKLLLDYTSSNIPQEQYERDIQIKFDQEFTENLSKKLKEKYNCSLSYIVFAASNYALSKFLNTEKLPVKFIEHGRGSIIKNMNSEKLVGWMVSRYPIVLKCKNKEDKEQILKDTIKTFKEVPLNGLGFGLLRYLNEKTKDVLSSYKESPILINFYGKNSLFEKPFKERLRVSPIIKTKTSYAGAAKKKNYLEIYGAILNNSLVVNLHYHSNCHKKSTIKAITDDLDEFIKSI